MPEGNRNLVFGLIIPPPGYNLDTTQNVAERIENVAKPLWEAGPERQTEEGTATIDNFFFVATPCNSLVGASAMDGVRKRTDCGAIATYLCRTRDVRIHDTAIAVWARGRQGAYDRVERIQSES
ncbi:MAG: hypothetical protein AAF214_05700 [Pseudomonadota bacterium]